MRKTITAGMAALTLGGAVFAAAAPAEARPYGYYGYHGYHHHGGNAGAAVAAGVVGLARGAALASSSAPPRYYAPPPPPPVYYEPGYYDYGYRPYATCYNRRWVWDPYLGRNVLITDRYAC